MSKCCGGLVVTGGDFGSIGHRFESWWWQSNFSLYIGDWNSSVKWREYFGSYLFAAKIPGTLAGNKTRNVSSNCRWEPAHNAIWPKFFRKLKTVYIESQFVQNVQSGTSNFPDQSHCYVFLQTVSNIYSGKGMHLCCSAKSKTILY